MAIRAVMKTAKDTDGDITKLCGEGGGEDDAAQFISERTQILSENMNYAYEKLAGVTGLRVTKPAGGFYIFCELDRHSELGKTLIGDIGNSLLKNAGVLITDGAAFLCDSGFRISLCLRPELFSEAIDKLCSYLVSINHNDL